MEEVPAELRMVSGKQEPASRLVCDNNPFVYPKEVLFGIMLPALSFGVGWEVGGWGMGLVAYGPNGYLQIVLLAIMIVEMKGI